MIHLKTPKEVQQHFYPYSRLEDIPASVFEEIRKGFEQIVSNTPVVSINIIAWNEERCILNNLSSLSKLSTQIPLEIVYVDNNSTDNTSEIIRRCGITPVLEPQQGYGFARQAAIKHSKGNYILTGDADTIYLPHWPEMMVKPLIEKRAIATFGTYSFLPKDGTNRSNLLFYETLRNILHKIRSYNRPELIVGGVNFCFERAMGLEIGFIRNNLRMEDGVMAANLKLRGKLLRITHPNTVAWTIPSRMQESGSQLAAIWLRLKKEAKQFHIYFTKKPLK